MKCRTCKNTFIEALYGELDAGQQEAFTQHLHGCEKCAAAFRELQSTLQVMSKRERQAADSAFLDGLWANMAPELEKSSGLNTKSAWLPRRFPAKYRFAPRWLLGFAGAVALLVVGIFIGKFYFAAPPQPTGVADKPPALSDARYAKIENRSMRYLERSKILLLGLVNYEPMEADSTILNFTYKKQLSRQLVQEAKVLQEDLTDARQLRLSKLVADIEMILLQIANMEETSDDETSDLPAIELIKISVDSKGIFLKINLEEMKSQTQDFESQKNRQQNRKL